MKTISVQQLKKECKGDEAEGCLKKHLKKLKKHPKQYSRQDLESLRSWARQLVNMQPMYKMTACEMIAAVDKIIGPEVGTTSECEHCPQD